ncbi:TonB-dependent receptor [Brevundimonas sp.]|uniref:TonB-dependent receptor n=1 Tax=Brevundimonas sp. TaxID=1871086 RepID=UPI00286C43CA|nr:TonB-dependent receptor [Brevundimonas sp.]
MNIKASRLRTLLGCGVATSVLLLAAQTQAQTADAVAEPEPDQSSQLDEIVVTALRRETNLQDTALSISALSGVTLEKMGASTLQDIIAAVPGLNLTEGNTGQRRISVRGVQSAGESTVGLYLGETPITGPNSATSDPSSMTPDLNMFDVSRVEVLRGPQGTLFGSGSMSGTFRVVFKEADIFNYEGAVDLTGTTIRGGSEGYAARGMVNVPLVEGLLGARLVLYDELRGGYVDNVRLRQEDINEVRAYGGRLMLNFTPVETFKVTGLVTLQNQDAADSNGWMPGVGEYKNDNYTKLSFPNEFRLYNLAAQWDLGAVTINGSTSIYSWDATKYIDGSLAALSVRAAGTYCARYNGVTGACNATQLANYRAYIDSVFPLSGYQPMEVESRIHELRATSNSDGPLTWTVGAFYEDRSDSAVSSTVEADPISGEAYVPIVYNFSRSIAVDLTQKALYGEATYEPFDGFRITAGVRAYEYEKLSRSQVLSTSFINASIAGPLTTYDSSASGQVFKLNLSYDITPDAMIYAQYSEGFRPGGINNTPGLTPDLIPYSSDSLENYEIGAKTSWFDNRLTVNLSAYEIRWSNMQIAANIPNFSFIANVGASTIKGLEIEASARPISGLSLNGSMGFVDGTLDVDQTTGLIVAAGRAGDTIPNEPEFKAAFAADYTWPIGSEIDGLLRLDYSYTGESISTFRPNSPFYETMGDFSSVNLRGGVEGDGWGAYLFVNNLFDEVGLVKVASSATQEQLTFSIPPRTVGVNLRRRF